MHTRDPLLPLLLLMSVCVCACGCMGASAGPIHLRSESGGLVLPPVSFGPDFTISTFVLASPDHGMGTARFEPTLRWAVPSVFM
jgi:hypothetical protein